MTARHYDVVVLGRSLGALTVAALLARRELRVLVLGHGARPPTYAHEELTLARRAFTLLFGSSPVWLRILRELAQTQTFKHRLQPLDPLFAVAMPERRLEIPPDPELLGRELDREFAEVRPIVDELYASIARINGAADAAFERDAVWPPGNFWERLETSRAAALLPLTEAGDPELLLGKFPAGHPYRDITVLPALFATDLEPRGEGLPPLALARLHGSWARGIQCLDGGEAELERFLVERIEAHGGVCKLGRHAEKLCIRRARAVGVIEDGEDDMTGADAIVSDQPGELLAELSGGEGVTKAARTHWPRLTTGSGRFVVTLLVAKEGIPDPLPRESFLLPPKAARPDPRVVPVHLQRLDVPASRENPRGPLDARTLVAEMILPNRGPLTLLEARHAVVAMIRRHLPFLDRHLLLVDSPHDGLPLHDFRTGRRRDVDRIHIPQTLASAEPMECLWTVEPPGYLGLGGEPVRGPIAGTFLTGTTVLPALGQEGQLLAAWGVARLIARQVRARPRVRRSSWHDLEVG